MSATDPFESLKTAISCHSRDWSTHARDAWIYGIVLGWDDEAIAELRARHGWDDDAVTRLRQLHETFERSADPRLLLRGA